MSPELKIVPRWAVPFAYVQHPQAEPLCAALRQLFLERAAQGETYKNRTYRDTQSGIFESRFDLHQWPQAPVQDLFRFIHASLSSFVQGASSTKAEEFRAHSFHYHSWFHVTHQGGHQAGHSHPMAAWSGIFCVDPGDAVETDPHQGSVRFHDPRAGANMYLDPSNENMIDAFRFASISHWHRAGLLVIFPSYLFHEVVPYRGTRPRIVVAFNAWMRPAKN